MKGDAKTAYEAAVAYLVANRWRREEEGSGWWYNGGKSEATIGEALEVQLDADGFDTRVAIPGEPREYWG